MKKLAFVVLTTIFCITVNWLTMLVGWWWITAVMGLLIGLFLRPAGLSFLASFWVGGLAWGLPLLVLATNAPVERIANAVESVIGLSATGGILIISLTVALGCVLSIVSTWVGVAGRKLYMPAQSRRIDT